VTGDGVVSVEPTGERTPYLFEASASEMASLVNSRARVQFNVTTRDYFLTWFSEEDGWCSIPLRENPVADVNDEYLVTLRQFIDDTRDFTVSLG
jgi:hypothetical protein